MIYIYMGRKTRNECQKQCVAVIYIYIYHIYMGRKTRNECQKQCVAVIYIYIIYICITISHIHIYHI